MAKKKDVPVFIEESKLSVSFLPNLHEDEVPLDGVAPDIDNGCSCPDWDVKSKERYWLHSSYPAGHSMP